MLVWPDPRYVHGVRLAGEIVECESDERGRCPAEEFMNRAAELGLIVRCARRSEHALTREAREQSTLLLLARAPRFLERGVPIDQADARALLDVSPFPEAGERCHVVRVRRSERQRGVLLSRL